MALTPKQQDFINFYLGDANGNATEAARLAGYSCPNQAGPRLLVNVGIQEAVSGRTTQAAMSANKVLERISELADADLGDFIDIDEAGGWTINLLKAKKAKKTRVIKKLKVTEFGTEIELHAPLPALDKLAQHHGLYIAKKLDELAAELERITAAQAKIGDVS